MSEREVQVQIYGTEFTLRTDDDPEELTALAGQVDGEMRRLAKETGLMNAQKIAILTALHLADELSKARRDGESLQEQSGAFCDRLEPLLDQAVGPAED